MLVNKQGVLLLIDGALHILTEVIHIPQVLLPVVINH